MKLSIILHWGKSVVKEFLLKRNLIITVPLDIRMVVHHDQFSSANAYRTLMIKNMELKERKNDCLQLQVQHDLENRRSQRVLIYDAT